ncbi:MAG: lipocalin family protein [Candidatus Falkowbacteria bacterium]
MMLEEFTPIEFPRDEASHRDMVEWWYFNGHLKDDGGQEYSFMDCLFQVDVHRCAVPLLNKTPLKFLYFSHSLLSDISHNIFKSTLNPFLWFKKINFKKTGDNIYHLKNKYVDLQMISTKAPLLEGGHGYLRLGSKATYYYSLTNLQTSGHIKINNKWIAVSGKSWMDHQWANANYSGDKWDWFSIQLDDNTEIICFAHNDNGVKTYLADIVYADGGREYFNEAEIIPSTETWTSPKTGASYPTAWTMKIPARNIELKLTAKIKQQEVLFAYINYWEGALAVTGNFSGQPVRGDAFMELVGYQKK